MIVRPGSALATLLLLANVALAQHAPDEHAPAPTPESAAHDMPAQEATPLDAPVSITSAQGGSAAHGAAGHDASAKAALPAPIMVPASPFADRVRALNAAQSRMAMGDEKARAEISNLLKEVEEAIAATEPEGWKEARNVRAATIYLLCGGAPGRLREVYEAQFIGEEWAALLEASLRHAEGHSIAGAKALLTFDARAYPSTLGGHLALVQSGALISDDKAKAVLLLDLARLLMPASFVEEAALRREIGAIDPLWQHDKFLHLANGYASRYSASPYAPAFWRNLRAALLSVAPSLAPELATKFDAVLTRAQRGERAEFALALARNALLRGSFAFAQEQLGKADKVATDAALRKRIAAYRAVIDTLSEESANAPMAANVIDWSSLPNEDMTALKIAESAARRVRGAGVATTNETPPAPSGADSAPSPIIRESQEALDKADALLRQAARP